MKNEKIKRSDIKYIKYYIHLTIINLAANAYQDGKVMDIRVP